MKEVAKAQSDLLLIFKKWEKFVQADCETAMIERLKEATRSEL